MAITEDTIVSQISSDALGNVSVRETTRVLRDGAVIAQEHHRRVIAPDDPDGPGDTAEVRAVRAAVVTPERIAAAAARRAELAEDEVAGV